MRPASFLISLLCCAFIPAKAEDRIREPIRNDRSVPLSQSLPRHAAPSRDAGALDAGTRIEGITLIFTPAEAQQAELNRLLEAQRDPSSPDYQGWLTPEQFGQRFGLSDNDLGAIQSWLQANGFAIDKVARARSWIIFSGSAGQVGRAFHTELRRVEVAGESHFANATEVRVPEALSGVVGAVHGLDDFQLTPLHTGILSRPELNAAGGMHYLAPGDFATIYDVQRLYNAGYDGTGQKLAVMGQAVVNIADLRAFRAQFSLPPKDPQMVLAGVSPGSSQADQTEATLDLEWAGAIARNAAIVYVYSQSVFQSLQYAIDENLAPVISLSYGGCELQASPTYRTLAQQANAQGITWVTAAGDSGAAGCDAAGQSQAKGGLAAAFPADIPEVTAVGGTEFNEGNGFYWQAQNSLSMASAVSYIPEKAWNDTSLGTGILAGGGAPSLVYSKPWWQTGAGVPNDQARDVPDLALTASGAHDAYAMTWKGQLSGVGGTSAASPAFAGIVAILNQYLLAKGTIGKPGLGNINPALYNLAQSTTGPFHDVISGNNDVTCVAGSKGCVNGSLGYPAGPGYDIATGLGSVDAFNLITQWSSAPPVTGLSMTLTATPASIPAGAAVQLTATVTSLSGMKPPPGSVTFSDGSTVLGLAALGGSGVTASATLSVRSAGLQVGVNTITARFGNQTATATVSVAAPAVVAPVATTMKVIASPPAIPQNGSAILTATVQAMTGSSLPVGTVVFTLGSTNLGSAPLSGGVATLTVKAASLPPGTDTITANYVPTGNFSNSTANVTVTVAAPVQTPVATTTVLVASPVTLLQTATTVLTATVKAASGSLLPTGAVAFSCGNELFATLPLVVSGASATATLALSGASLAVGSHSVAAVYIPSGNFVASSASVNIAVTAPLVPTTLILAAAPGKQASTTMLTATVKAAIGNATPSGNIAFALGTALLGVAPLSGSGGTAAATLTLNNNVFASGRNTITADFLGSPGFSASTGSTTVQK